MHHKERHVLIIGGAGYIGSILVRKLLNKNYKVRVLDKLLYDNCSSVSDYAEEKNFSFIYGDFGDETTLNNSLIDITDVVLLAALVGDPICKKYPDLAKIINLEYPKKLIYHLKSKSIDRFIFTSTCSNYGLRNNDSPADEDSGLNPLSLYAETKVEFEKYILNNLNNIHYSPTILRLATAFGISKRMRFDLTISEFSKELALGKELIVFDENTWRPYCHISDISNAIISVLEAPKEKVYGQIFNVGSNNENYTKKMIVDLIQKYVGNASIKYKQGGFDPRNYRVAFDKIKNMLNYKPHHQAEESIKQIISAVKNNLYSDVEIRKNFYGNYFIQQ